MQRNSIKRLVAVACFFVANGVLVGCSKDTLVPDVAASAPVTGTATQTTGTTTNTNTGSTGSTSSNTTSTGSATSTGSTSTTGTATTTTTSGTTTSTATGSAGTSSSGIASYSPSAKWKTRANGTYTLAQAQQDYMNPINGWSDARMAISGGQLRTTLTKTVVGPEGGLVSWVDVADGSEYQLQFDMKFDSQFDFSAGGKVGFGFLIGEGYTGGEPASNGNGGSARIMWYKGWDGRVYLKPYIYHKDQPGTYGDDFGITYPSSGSIQKNTWYTVKMYFKANTGSNTDGKLRITINGTTIVDKNIRWTTNDLKRLVNRVTFETFRGGADASWTSSTDGYVYFDNVSWTALQY